MGERENGRMGERENGGRRTESRGDETIPADSTTSHSQTHTEDCGQFRGRHVSCMLCWPIAVPASAPNLGWDGVE